MINGFSLLVSDDGRDLRVAVEGEIDLAVAPRLLDVLLCAAEVYDGRVIVLDLSGVSFMDCTGLTVLTQVHEQLCRQQCHLVLENPAPIVARVIALTGLDSLVDIRADSDSRRTQGPAPPGGSGASMSFPLRSDA